MTQETDVIRQSKLHAEENLLGDRWKKAMRTVAQLFSWDVNMCCFPLCPFTSLPNLKTCLSSFCWCFCRVFSMTISPATTDVASPISVFPSQESAALSWYYWVCSSVLEPLRLADTAMSDILGLTPLITEVYANSLMCIHVTCLPRDKSKFFLHQGNDSLRNLPRFPFLWKMCRIKEVS